MTEQSREEFDSWAKERGLINDLIGLRNVNESFLNECWAAWQASRVAVVVRIPPATHESFGNSAEWLKGFGAGSAFKEQVIMSAIEAQGLTVK